MKGLLILIALISILSQPVMPNKSNPLSFRHITANDGLNHNSIIEITQDHLGFLWFASENGLQRYDGVDLKTFLHNSQDSTSLSGNVIFSVLEDDEQNLWVATNAGLNRYEQERGNFSRIGLVHNEGQAPRVTYEYYVPAIAKSHNGQIYISWGNHGIWAYNKAKDLLIQTNIQDEKGESLHLGNITELFFDSDNLLWMGSKSEGLFCFNPATQTTMNYRKEHPSSVRSNFIYAIREDQYQRIFVSNENGLDLFNKETGTFNRYTPPGNKKYAFEEDWVWYMNSDSEGNLWFCSNRYGLHKMINKEMEIISYVADERNPESLNDNNIQCFFEDRQGNYWVGTQRGGVNYSLNNNTQVFNKIVRNPLLNNTLTHSRISALLENDEGHLFIGTDGGGLNIYNRKNGHFILPDQSKYHFKYTEDAILAMYLESNGNLWTGGFLTGLNLYIPGKDKITWKNNQADPRSLGNNDVRDILKDSRGNYWVTTNGGGLNLFNPIDGTFKQFLYQAGQNSISSNFTLTLTEDHRGYIWLGTYEGLDRINTTNFSIKNYSKTQNLTGDWIYALLEDSKNQLWVGTNMAIHRYDDQTDSFINYNDSIDLPNNIISGILEDNNGHLWISTSNGLASYNQQTKETRNYFNYDGLPGNFFNPGAAYKNKEGLLFFGTSEGLVYFNPDDITTNQQAPPVYITDIAFAPDTRQKHHLNSGDTIVINYKAAASVNFYFSALNFINPQKNNYAYQLENADSEWRYVSNQKMATYTNLSPGEYKFRVKASNNDQFWNEEGSYIFLTITPPIWKTTAAYILYLLAITLLLRFIWTYALVKARYVDKLKIERLKAEKAEELSKLKTDFFINISHELSTPLTLIMAPVEKLIQNNNEDSRLLQIIHRNTKALMRLINELLDSQKIEEQQKKAEYSYSDIIAYIKTISEDFHQYATNNNISIDFSSSTPTYLFPFSPDDLDKIMRNLISNAIKYNKPNGNVNITLEVENEPLLKHKPGIIIKVSDTGRGIDQENIQNIFNRFFRVQEKNTSRKGHGIGLYLTKQLVELHQGTIFIDSAPDRGTIFTVKLPYTVTEFNLSQKEDYRKEGVLVPEELKGENTKTSKNKPSILIAEDNAELRDLLKILLSDHYRLVFAENGLEALGKIQNHLPDLVLTDIMMPLMDGMELCKHIKRDFITSHIPVLMLTALNSGDMMVKGLNTGADDYVAKPFNPEILLARISNLVESRKRLQQRFITNLKTQPSEMGITSADEQFLNKLHQVIETHIDNSDYDVTRLASEMNMSSITLYRKIKALTGLSVNPFIRTIRLKKAATLLGTKTMSVPEVALNVGFNDVKYFRKCFHKQFNMNPSDYAGSYNNSF